MASHAQHYISTMHATRLHPAQTMSQQHLMHMYKQTLNRPRTQKMKAKRHSTELTTCKRADL